MVAAVLVIRITEEPARMAARQLVKTRGNLKLSSGSIPGARSGTPLNSRHPYWLFCLHVIVDYDSIQCWLKGLHQHKNSGVDRTRDEAGKSVAERREVEMSKRSPLAVTVSEPGRHASGQRTA